MLKLKEWLTVPEAARHLTILFGEEVGEADVLRFALDGRLTLSAHFPNHAYARCGPVVPRDRASYTLADPMPWEQLPPGAPEGVKVALYNGLELGPYEVLEYGDRSVPITGVWDLTMRGAESIDVEHRYQRLTRGPAVELFNIDGVILSRPDGMFCQLQDHFGDNEFCKPESLHKPWDHPRNFYPAAKLPADSVLVVRTTALEALLRQVSEPPQRPASVLGARERTTLLVMLAALAELAKVDWRRPSKAAQAIERQTELLGARVAARTAEGHLNKVAEALEHRST